jgi:hypothetical protein
MGPGNFEFGQVRDYLERQQRRIAELESENRTLRRELDELRRGVGIAVMIHGRAVPLAPLPPAGTAANPRHSVTTSGQHPAVMPVASGPIPGAGPIPHVQPTQQPAANFPEANWLTGSQPALRAQPRPEQTAGPRQAHTLRPSERITPEWLREATASQAPGSERPNVWDAAYVAGSPGATPSQIPATPSRILATPSQPGEWPAPRAARSRRSHASAPLPPLPLPSEPPYPSLAELTGQLPAVQRKPRRQANERNPYDDSFVLG